MARRRTSEPFTKVGDGLVVSLAAESRTELAQVAEIVLSLVEGPADPLFPPAVAPDEHSDPAMARLFPVAYADGVAAAEFRRLSEGDLRAGKRRDAERLQATVNDNAIGSDDAEAWLRSINDVRLVLAVRLGIEADGDTERLLEKIGDSGVEPATAVLIGMFMRMGMISELLIEALDG